MDSGGMQYCILRFDFLDGFRRHAVLYPVSFDSISFVYLYFSTLYWKIVYTDLTFDSSPFHRFFFSIVDVFIQDSLLESQFYPFSFGFCLSSQVLEFNMK